MNNNEYDYAITYSSDSLFITCTIDVHAYLFIYLKEADRNINL